MKDSFYITLPSNSSMDLYSGNTTSHFITQLRESIQLNDEWEVSLVELHYPQTVFNVSKGNNSISVSYKLVKEDKPYNAFKTVYIKPGFYVNGQQLVKAINLVLAPLEIGYVQLDDDTGMCSIVLNENAKGTLIEFDTILGQQLGFNPELNIGQNLHATSFLDIDLGLPSFLFVYCDIIDAQIVGNTVAPLLRLVNSKFKNHSFGEQITQEFSSLQYVPILKRQFNNIEIDLRTSSGDRIPFQTGTSAVLLHFRRCGLDK